MATQVLANASHKLIKSEAQKRGKKEDPYFEEYEEKSRFTGRVKISKRKKEAPSELSKNDQKVYKKVRNMAKSLDAGLINRCGIKIGWSALIGLAPGVGDLADVFLALNVLRHCEKIDGGLPASTRSRMQLNIAIDFVVGLVPIAGDIADAFYKANTRNLLLLEKVLRKRAAEIREGKMLQQQQQQPQQPEMIDAVAHGGLAPAATDQYGHGRGNGNASRETSRSRGGQAPVREYSAIGHGGGGSARPSREERRYHHQGSQHHGGRPEHGVGFS